MKHLLIEILLKKRRNIYVEFLKVNVKSLKGRMRKCGGPRVAHPCFRGILQTILLSSGDI